MTGTTLAQLATALGGHLSGEAGAIARGVRHDSRAVEPGDVFVALRGRSRRGAEFAAQALERGACAVVCDEPLALAAPVIHVADARRALATLAELLYGEPSRALDVVGITGTNGKTTTSFLLRAALEASGARPALVGTLGTHWPHGELPQQASALNTPEADELARTLAWLAGAGATHAVLEVTSHAIAERRVEATHFAVAAFTNLSHDHLDLHGDMASYAAAKRRLFTELAPERAVVMVDDPLGQELAATTRALTVSIRPDASAAIRPLAAPRCDARGVGCEVATPSGPVALASGLVGMHNLSNMLLALGIAVALGLDVAGAVAAIGAAPAVPGRLERCDGPDDDIVALVDYAHTPDALEKALGAARLLGTGRLVCVFGCGGERDALKRPRMGEVAGRLADVAIVTSDNPRSEDPGAIADAVVAGLAPHGRPHACILDRREAIAHAVAIAAQGDVLLVAGKGHETTQTIAGAAHPFDDRDVLRQLLARSRLRAGTRCS